MVDLHGPHEHQSLLQPSRQLAILDAFGRLTQQVDAFAVLVRQRAEIEAARRALRVDERTVAQQLDLLRFQVREIDAARLQPADETDLEIEYRRAGNAVRLRQLTETALQALGEQDDSALATLGVEPPITLADIKSRYKTLAKKYHPDRSGGDKKAEERFKEVNQAYTYLLSCGYT